MNNFDLVAEQQNRINRLNNPVLDVFASLREYAEEFERGLDAGQEVGARLVSFGSEITLHVRQIGYAKPNIITFDGFLENGSRVKLVQHVSQLSVLFVAVPVKAESQKRPIGFVSA
jgi:hypothetical protein